MVTEDQVLAEDVAIAGADIGHLGLGLPAQRYADAAEQQSTSKSAQASYP